MGAEPLQIVQPFEADDLFSDSRMRHVVLSELQAMQCFEPQRQVRAAPTAFALRILLGSANGTVDFGYRWHE